MNSPTAAVSAAQGGRVVWLDLARAASIALVVVYHVAVGAGADLLGGGGSLIAQLWVDANMALVPLRMPLFFAVSGVLAAGALNRPWSAVVRPRVLDLLWPYVVWSMLFAVTAWPRYSPDDASGFIGGEVSRMIMLAAPYWFIAVLPIFFVLTRLGRARPGLTVAAALIVYAAAPYLEQAMEAAQMPSDLVHGVSRLTGNCLWFVLGYAARHRILRVGRRGRPLLGALLTVVFCLLAVNVLRDDLPVAVLRTVELTASITGLTACAVLLPLLGRWELLGRIGSHLGSRTLVIYLVHPLVINGVVMLWRAADPQGAAVTGARDLLIVPATTVLAIGVALLVHAAITRFGPRWLLRAPGGRGTGGRDMRNTAQARRPSS